MLTRAQIKKLPPDPVGFTPLLHRHCFNRVPAAFLRLTYLPAAFPLLEVMPGANEAEELLGFYLSRRTIGSGLVTPVSLAEVIIYAAHDTIVVPHPLLLILNRVLAYVRVSAMASHYGEMPWHHLPYAHSPYCTYRVYPDQRAEACELARYLRDLRPEMSK